jgi:hypothetical protein
MLTNNFQNIIFMQPMRRLKHRERRAQYFFLFGFWGGGGGRGREGIFDFFFCSQSVPKEFPKFPMCSPQKFPIAQHINPICFAQSSPLSHLELVTKVEPYTNSVEVHPQLSNMRHPVDGALVGDGLLWPYLRIHDLFKWNAQNELINYSTNMC